MESTVQFEIFFSLIARSLQLVFVVDVLMFLMLCDVGHFRFFFLDLIDFDKMKLVK